MPTYDIDGTQVDFPYEAYECQLAYMHSVIRALQSGHHALLESPTGTGKTLCLLCATLGWRRRRAAEISQARMSWEHQALHPAEVPVQIPQIWYASRTHSQLKQVVRELKRTSYKPSSVVLGSREHFCVHTSVSRQTGARQNAHCRRARDENRCRYYVNFRKGIGSKVNTNLMDIEEIVSASKEHEVCPYYKTREDAKDCDLMLIPYDYVINPATRESLQVGLKGSVLIFDEGHNIEKSCEEVASMELSGKDLAGAVQDIDDALFVLDSYPENCEEVLKDMTAEMFKAHLNLLRTQILALEDAVCAQPLRTEETLMQRNIYKAPGSYIVQLLGRGSTRIPNGDGITKKDMKRIAQVVRNTILVLTFSTDGNVNAGVQLDSLLKFLQTAFLREEADLDKNYQVLVYDDGAPRGTKRKSMDFFSSDTANDPSRACRTVALWCFSCSVAMRDLQQLGIHSLIVTSGTLSPLDATAESFGIPFPVVLENKHVIEQQQVCGGVLPVGPTGVPLDGSYGSREGSEYIAELCRTVAELIASVPDGVLLAFQSYAQKARVLSHWRQTGDLELITQRKPLFDEPQGNAEMKRVMQDYSLALDKPAAPGRPSGGILAAVCRGRLCEGIDFTDRQCRLVIVVGVPFPNKSELKVMLKQEFLDRQSREAGRAWYVREAVRAVNQTVGRVIRHRSDFGAAILCDGRYASFNRLSEVAQGLSTWLRPAMCVYSSFSDALSTCDSFFQRHGHAGLRIDDAQADMGETERKPPKEPMRATSSDDQPLRAALASARSSLRQETRSTPADVASCLPGRQVQGVRPTSMPIAQALAAAFKRRHMLTHSNGIAAEAVQQQAEAEAEATKEPAPKEMKPTQASDHSSAALADRAADRAPATPQAARPHVQPVQNPEPKAVCSIQSQAKGPDPKSQLQRLSLAEQGRLKRWLDDAQGLVPRMDFEALEGMMTSMIAEARSFAAATGPEAKEKEERLLEAMRRAIQVIIPAFSFDTREEEQKRQRLVRDGKLLMPEPMHSIWRNVVVKVQRERGLPTGLA
mmetsp:Transcript_10844/g.24855  ORF Transcript_10844/g.24855 Transcript_10844/m.24855 type:complete len:1037 (+) Transcript_10844:52-3162(+)